VILFLLLGEHRTHIVLAYKFIVSLVDGAYMYYVANVIFKRFSSVWFKPTGASPRAWARLKTLVEARCQDAAAACRGCPRAIA
jgi:hypothetical protein